MIAIYKPTLERKNELIKIKDLLTSDLSRVETMWSMQAIQDYINKVENEMKMYKRQVQISKNTWELMDIPDEELG